MDRKWMVAILSIWLANSAAAQTQSDTARAELLYSTHCIACHDTDIHWRDKKLAADWISLKAQVRRWQAIATLGWRDDDITLVARHLNAKHYHYSERVQRSGVVANPSRAPASSPPLPSIPDKPLR